MSLVLMTMKKAAMEKECKCKLEMKVLEIKWNDG